MKEKKIKDDRFYRSATVARGAIDAEARTVDLAFSSEAEIERYFGIEILSHDKDAIDLERLKNAAPLLVDHDPTDQVGVIEEVWIGADRMGRARVRFGKSARAEEVFQDVVDGIRQLVSTTYAIKELKLTEEHDDARDVYTVTRWEPLEISIVSIPADVSVGVGRSDELADGEQTIPDLGERKEQIEMSEKLEATPAPTPPAVTHSAAQARGERWRPGRRGLPRSTKPAAGRPFPRREIPTDSSRFDTRSRRASAATRSRPRAALGIADPVKCLLG